MSKFIKKSHKLFKNPRAFFKDSIFFNGRRDNTSFELTADVKKVNVIGRMDSSGDDIKPPKNNVVFSNLSENWVTPHDQEEILFTLLDKAGINYHIIETEWRHIIRVAIQDSFIKNVVELIKKCNSFTKYAYVVDGKDRFDLVKIYFHDEKIVYKNTIFQIDPWYVTPHGIMTRNKNTQIQFIPKAHVNKTVHSFAPIRLGKTIQQIDTLKSMVGVDSFLFDEYEGPVDIVFTWVSDSDPNWVKKKSAYLGEDFKPQTTRFVDYEQLRYSLRSVASYAKFIRRIFIVTDNQIPYWLDSEHEKITIINHEDIFEDKSSLPVFNSVAIESWIHKIEGLSDNFIYANDDYFFGSPVTKKHFIHSNGVARLFVEPVPNAYGEIFEDSESTNQLSLFTARCFYERFNRWPSFWPLHAPMVKNIHVINDMVSEFKDLVEKTSRSRFRESGTISPLYLMASYYAYMEGYSVISSVKYEYVSSDDPNLDSKLSDLLRKIKNGDCDIFCLNDHRTVTEAQIIKVVNFMKAAFPVAAEWELDNKY